MGPLESVPGPFSIFHSPFPQLGTHSSLIAVAGLTLKA
jgi:hypothetical protein